MLDLDLIEDPARAALVLDPIRSRLLTELAAPASAASVAERVGLTRQKVDYHLRVLEAHGLVEAAGKRRGGGLTERLLVAPAALGRLGADPARMATVSRRATSTRSPRAIREVDRLWRAARRGDRLQRRARALRS